MNTTLNDTKEIIKSKPRKNTLDDGRVFYSMNIDFIHIELGKCNEENLLKEVEVTTTITLFADNKEALKIKAEVLS